MYPSIKFEKNRSRDWSYQFPVWYSPYYINSKQICVITYRSTSVIWTYYIEKTGKMGNHRIAPRVKFNGKLGFYVKNIFVKTQK